MMKCSECGRKVVMDGTDYKHTDGRVHHDPVIEEETEMSPNTRVVPQEGEPYVPIVDAKENLVPEAMEIFADMEPELGDLETDPPQEVPIGVGPVTSVDGMIDPDYVAWKAEQEAEIDTDEEKAVLTPSDPPAPEPDKPMFGRPTKEKMITVRGGGKYLKARDRIGWMRGEPEQHPDWTIDTIPEEIVRGNLKGKDKVEGGYARIRANVYDETGRLIAAGTKTEFSERFMDFVEKAETGAIARALAVAGYGTEAALDLDEGYDADRIADAPATERPITISASAVEGLVQGGRSENATQAQLNEIERLAVEKEIGPNIVTLIENVCKVVVPDLSDNPGEVLRDFLKGMSFEQAADLIGAMQKA